MSHNRRYQFTRYGAAILSSVAAAVLMVLIQPVAGRSYFLLFYPAVAFSAWYGGVGPGIVATIATGLLSDYYFIPPNYVFFSTPQNVLQIFTYWLSCFFIILIVEARNRAEGRAREGLERFVTTLSSIGDAVIVTDVTGKVTFMNSVAETLTGWPNTQAKDKPLQEVFKIVNEYTREAVENPAEKVMRTGAVIGLANHTVLLNRNGTQIPIDDSGAPIRDAKRGVLGVVLVFRDITQRKRDEEAQRFLTEASSQLASSLDYQTTLKNVSDLAVRQIADWCSVHTVEPDGSVQQLAVSHIDPAMVEWAYDLQKRYPPDPNRRTGLYEVLRTGKPEFMPEIPETLLAPVKDNAEIMAIWKKLSPVSVIVTPMISNGRILGAIQFVTAESGRHYGAADLKLAQDLARHAALAVDNSRLYRDAEQARKAAEQAALRTAQLQAITAALVKPLTAKEAAKAVIEQGILAVGAHSGLVALLNYSGNTLEIVSDQGYPDGVLQPFGQMPLNGDLPIAVIVRSREPAFIESKADWDTTFPQGRAVMPVDSLAIIPLIVDERAIGGIVFRFNAERQFDADARGFMLSLAQQGAQGIARAQLFAEVQASAETLKQKVAERTAELQTALEQAQSADRTKSALLATVSHEMRTPLSSIIGFSNLILSRSPEQAKLMDYVNYINVEARRLATLINDFLDLQRIESGREVFRFSEIDMSDLIRDVLDKQDLAEHSQHTLRLDLDSVPKVYADSERIRQVILNLLSNAFKYSTEGEVFIALHTVNDEVVFSIRDHGLGIPVEEQSHLFERFFRGNAAERNRIRGTGLGLALCREIIQMHHGRIWVESPGQNLGTTFYFALPVQQSPIQSETIQPGKAAIVVVEDDRNFSLYLRERLSLEGYTIHLLGFEDASAGRIGDIAPLLVVLDILQEDQRPGWPLLAALKENPRTTNIPVLICSISEEAQQSWNLGAAGFVPKPVDEALLMSEVNRLIDNSSRQTIAK